jgi:nitroreductase
MEKRNLHMEFRDLVLRRRMVRHFTDEPVAPEAIDRMLDLARHAPSAGFTQGQSFVVVTRPELKRAIAQLCGEESYVESGSPIYLGRSGAARPLHQRGRLPPPLPGGR